VGILALALVVGRSRGLRALALVVGRLRELLGGGDGVFGRSGVLLRDGILLRSGVSLRSGLLRWGLPLPSRRFRLVGSRGLLGSGRGFGLLRIRLRHDPLGARRERLDQGLQARASDPGALQPLQDRRAAAGQRGLQLGEPP
jgi:hypothetical protein